MLGGIKTIRGEKPLLQRGKLIHTKKLSDNKTELDYQAPTISGCTLDTPAGWESPGPGLRSKPQGPA